MPDKQAPPTQFSTWNAHVAATRKKHPDLSMKQAMKKASETYTKKPKTKTKT
jgi:hypothetical protein